MRDSLIVFVFFAVGVALGYADAVPTWLLDPDLPMIILSVMVVLVGLGLGAGDNLHYMLRTFNWREMIALFGMPLFARWGGPLAPISVAGVTSMDVCLPSIARYSGSDLVPLAILHGIVLEVCVPILVGAFC